MSVSGSYDFNMTRNEIIADALYNIQAIPIGHTPSSKDVAICGRMLNRLIKELQSDHVYLNAVTQRNFDTEADVNTYQLTTGVKKVLGTPYLRIDGSDTPLNILSRQDYDSITTKAAPAQPEDVYIDYSTSPPSMVFSGTPNAIYAVYYRSEDILDDMDEQSDNPQLPQTALTMLVEGLSYKLCNPYRQTTSFKDSMGDQYEKSKRIFKSGDIARDGDDKVAPSWVV